MQLVIKSYKSLPCELEIFMINGKKANKNDFGKSKDYRENEDLSTFDEDIIQYGCCNMQFNADPMLCDHAMNRYNITEDEFKQICDTLECELYVGQCGWCV